MSTGEYTPDLAALGLDLSGEPVTNYGYGTISAVKTNYFTCRASASGGGSYSAAISYCNREPRARFYGIGRLENGRLFCHGYNALGRQICRSYGTQTVPIGPNATGYLFN